MIITCAVKEMQGTVSKLIKYKYGTPIGVCHKNPLLDTIKYELAFDDGETISYGYNVITDNIYSQCDGEGNLVWISLAGLVQGP